MKTQSLKLLLLVSCFIIASKSLAQTNPSELFIPKPTSQVYLDDIIREDNPNNIPKDPNRVYVLEKGGFYFIKSHLANTGWTLRIKAQTGTVDNERPIITIIANPATGTPPGRLFYVEGDIWLKDLALVGRLEADPASYAWNVGGLIQTNKAGYRIYVDHCIISNTSGNHIRTDQAARAVIVKNSTFANMGYLGTSNLGGGKAIDMRDGSCDSLIVNNNTFVNCQDRIIRHYTSKASIRVFQFDHNTVVNSMSYHGMLSLGKVGKEVRITNNLFLDNFSLGNDTDYVRQKEFSDSGEKDSRGNPRMTWVITEPNDTTKFNIKNNIYGVSPAGQAWFDKNKNVGVTGEGAPLTWHINKKIGADSTKTFLKQTFTLPKVPTLMTAMMDWYRDPNGGNKTKNTPTAKWIREQHDYDRQPLTYFMGTLNCAYSTSLTALYSGAEKGFPVGDLNWFPTRKADWEKSGGTAVKEKESLPANFSLEQNYPNPFNPSTKIAFSIPIESFTNLEVYNLLGQRVATIVNERLVAGAHEYNFNASNLTSGIYFYQIQSGNFIQVRKMVLIK